MNKTHKQNKYMENEKDHNIQKEVKLKIHTHVYTYVHVYVLYIIFYCM